MTTQDKLTRLIDTKIAIRQAIMNLGVDVPYDTPFSGYPELISKIVGDFEETTTDQDLLQMVDAYNFLGIDGYEDHTYTDEELQRINELIDIIINGPEEVEPELEPTVLLITNIGETRYHEGETFSLDDYTITAVYGDGRRVDVTADCSFTPSVELVTEDKYVTISCEIDGAILTVKQAINVTVAPTFVDYIQSSGTQYINTEFVPNQDTKVVADIQMIQATYSDGWQPLFGSRMSSSATDRFVVWRAGDDNNLASMYGSYPTTLEGIPISGTLLDRNVITLDKNKLYYNDVLLDTGDLSVFHGACSIYLFSVNTGGTVDSRKPIMRVFSFKIYDNGVLVKDFKPCQDSTGTYCLYDAVSKRYHYNQGTGTFTGGMFLEPEQFDYIESTGAQYIDTGIIPTQNTRVKAQVAFPTIAQQQYAVIAGTQNNENGTNAFLMFCTDSLNARTGDSGGITTGLYAETNKSYDLELEFNNYTINGDSFSGELTWTKDITGTLYLFARNCAAINTVYPDSRAIVQLSYFQIYESDTLIRNYVPYKDEFGVVCLKDLVENKYYYNKGTGVFTGGMFLEPEQLDYIESTGTQYIDTGVIPTANTTYEISVDIDTPTIQTDTCLFGSRPTGGSDQFILWDGHNNTSVTRKSIFVAGTLGEGVTVQPNVTQTVFKYDNGNTYVNGEFTGALLNKITSANKYSLYLFALNQANVADSRMYRGKFYYFKIFENGTLIRNFVPYKDKFGTCCIKDLVENKYYYNKGTGKFLGPIPSNLTVLNYIETTGTQYINTGISAPNGYRAVLKTNITGFTTGYSVLVGSHESSSPYKDNYLRYLNTGVPELGMYNSLKVTNITLQSGIDYTIDSNNIYNKHYLKINGVSATFSGSTSSNTKSDKTLGLMGLHTGNNVGSQFAKAKLYYCKIYSDINVLLRDFIPCKDNYEVVCMYDRVSDQYFYNQGTGEFLGE